MASATKGRHGAIQVPLSKRTSSPSVLKPENLLFAILPRIALNLLQNTLPPQNRLRSEREYEKSCHAVFLLPAFASHHCPAGVLILPLADGFNIGSPALPLSERARPPESGNDQLDQERSLALVADGQKICQPF